MCSSICKCLVLFAAGAAVGMIAMPYLTEMCDNQTCKCIKDDMIPELANGVQNGMRKLKRTMGRKYC